MAKIIKVRHIKPEIDSKLGHGFVTGYTQATALNEKHEPITTVFANVSWSKVRNPAVSFHSPTELAWIEIEGVDEDGDLISNFDLAEADEMDEDYEDDADEAREVRA